MEEILERILACLDSMEQGQQQLTKRLDSRENRLGGIEGQLSETNQIARAIEHRTEEITAEVNNIGLTVA
ncbi:MAG TPA: hypothetical protein VGL27_11980 [Negativicutes bacterium]|jgi:hypothetical protein